MTDEADLLPEGLGDEELAVIAGIVLERFRRAGWKLAMAESCTGGLVASALTAIAGSSDAFDRGFVTYSNQAKTEMLGVPAETIEAHGAVSAETALAMASGALKQSGADAAGAITGVAGPGGGSKEKPVGLVYVAVACQGQEGTYVERFEFGDIGRGEVRLTAAKMVLEMLLAYAFDDDG